MNYPNNFSHGNSTIDLHPADVAIAIYSIVISILGLLTNGLVLIIILYKKELRSKDYIGFIFNRVLNDFACCIFLGFGQPSAILLQSEDLCKVVGFIDVSLSMSTILAEPMLTFNRYTSIFYSTWHKKIFNTRNVYLMCITVWVLGFITSVPHIFTHSLGRVPGVLCCVNLTRDSVLVTMLSNYIPVVLSVVIVGTLNYKIYVFLRQHQNQQTTNGQRTKLQADREMLRFIIATACLPIILQIPIAASYWIQMFVPLSIWLLFFVTALFVITFPVNPLVALFMVRPLRDQFVRMMSYCKGKTTTVSVLNSYPDALAKASINQNMNSRNGK